MSWEREGERGWLKRTPHFVLAFSSPISLYYETNHHTKQNRALLCCLWVAMVSRWLLCVTEWRPILWDELLISARHLFVVWSLRFWDTERSRPPRYVSLSYQLLLHADVFGLMMDGIERDLKQTNKLPPRPRPPLLLTFISPLSSPPPPIHSSEPSISASMLTRWSPCPKTDLYTLADKWRRLSTTRTWWRMFASRHQRDTPSDREDTLASSRTSDQGEETVRTWQWSSWSDLVFYYDNDRNIDSKV